jgi:hypothetical protein
MDAHESNGETGQPGRRERRAMALAEVRALGDKVRAERYRPDIYAVTERLGLSSQPMAQRLMATRRLDERLALLVPRTAPSPRPEEILHAETSDMPPLPQMQERARNDLSGERLMLVANNIASAIECLNKSAMIGREELQSLIRNYGQDAMRFGLKFRSSVPIYLLELLRSGRGDPLQLAATAILVWNEVEGQTLPGEIQKSLGQMRPVPVQTLDNPQETADLVRYALTALKT